MKRKVVKHGPSTFIVSLPSGWIKRYGIKKGDELEVEQNANSLIISTESSTGLSGTFDFSNYPQFLAKKMIARIYEMGYDNITINYSDIEQVKQLEDRMPELMGFEVIEIGKKTMQVQDISSNINLDFDNILRKAFIIAKSMFSSLIEDIRSNDLSKVSRIAEQDLILNKFSYFCLRQINKNTIPNNEVYVLFYLSKSLEDLGDIIKRFIEDVEKKGKVDKKVLQILTEIEVLFQYAYDFFYKPKVKTIVENLDLKEKLIEDIREYSQKCDKETVILLFHLNEMVRKIYHFPTLRMHTLVEKED